MAQVECCKQHELEKNNLYLSAIILDVILHYLFKCGPTEKKKSTCLRNTGNTEPNWVMIMTYVTSD